MARTTDAALAAAPHLTARAVDQIRALVGHCGPYCPVMARHVAENMRALGVYSTEAHRGYFAQLGVHFAGALHVFRCAGRNRGKGVSDELARIVTERVELDESVVHLQEAAARGQGTIIMGPHIANYLLGLARLSREVPLTIYFRYSTDTRRQAPKQRWCRAAGIRWLFEPATEGGPRGRLGRITAALNQGRTVYIPPDLPRKRGNGTPVRFFQREVYLPAGAAVLAVRTGAPLFMLLARSSGPRLRLVVRGPFAAEPNQGGPAAERAAVQRHLQRFATLFEQFLIEQTPLWYFWGDKRWTRVLHGDPGYTCPLEGSAPDATAPAATRTTGAV